MHNKLKLCLLLLAIWSIKLLAQISAYHSIVFPYDSYSRLPQTVGGTTIAIPDFVSAAQINPAGLAVNQVPQFGIHLGQRITRTHIKSDYPNPSTSFDEYSFDNGLVSGSIPITIFNKKIVVAVSAIKIQTPEFDIWEPIAETMDQQIRHSRQGNVWNATLGLGGAITDYLSYGISVTKWFGQWSWHDEINFSTIEGEGKFKYTGSSLTLGLSQQFRKISLAVAVHTPFTLMKSNKIRLKTEFGESVHQVGQYFKGAARLGIGYHLNPQLILGAGYRYQDNIIMKDHIVSEPANSTEDKYGESHQISIGGEYSFSWAKIKLPVFFAYRIAWMRDVQRDYLSEYQILQTEKGKEFSHEIILGLNFSFKSTTIYLVSQVNSSPIQVRNNIVPPFS